MPAGRFARAVYSRAAGSRALRRPLGAIRSHPRVRAFARRHVQVLLARGTTWANVDGALRLLAEDPRQQITFGPWEGDTATELLYWAPFVRWAQEHFSLDPARVTIVSRGGVGHWYGEACGTYAETLDAGADLALFSPAPVLALVDEYRSGNAAPRPLLKRARHVTLLPPPAPNGLPDAYVAVGAECLVQLPGSVVTIDETQPAGAQHALLARATGLVAAWSGLALLGVLSGVPTIALRPTGGEVCEPDLDLALRVAAELGTSLNIVDAAALERLEHALR
jgi:hypothetical protein